MGTPYPGNQTYYAPGIIIHSSLVQGLRLDTLGVLVSRNTRVISHQQSFNNPQKFNVFHDAPTQ